MTQLQSGMILCVRMLLLSQNNSGTSSQKKFIHHADNTWWGGGGRQIVKVEIQTSRKNKAHTPVVSILYFRTNSPGSRYRLHLKTQTALCISTVFGKTNQEAAVLALPQAFAHQTSS